jgi:hypothetical protein
MAFLGLGLLLVANVAMADRGDGSRSGKFCSATAMLQQTACRNEARDDYLTAKAICINGNEDQGEECRDEATETLHEDYRHCQTQRHARRQLCAALGEDRYDPNFDPALFEYDFRNLSTSNPYFPLAIGNHWKYQGGDETIEVRILDQTKLIEGVTCIVVNDLVKEDGVDLEDTDDWYGQRRDGTVDYCGEISKNFELFAGDDPEVAELVDVEGSWKAGRDGDLAGTQFPRWPEVGMVYRQEWSPGNAEDAARVVSVSYRYGDEREFDRHVPRALARLLCSLGDCVVTAEFTPVEPGVLEYKYYAPGIGLFLEVDPESGDVVQLVKCNMDPRCRSLPAP